jgi:hypothetical protein
MFSTDLPLPIHVFCWLLSLQPPRTNHCICTRSATQLDKLVALVEERLPVSFEDEDEDEDEDEEEDYMDEDEEEGGMWCSSSSSSI